MFTTSDYVIFFTLLIISFLIGLYYGFCGKKQNTAEEYLLGGKTLKVVPVAMSLIASNCSAITLISVPADVYRFGINYWWTVGSVIVASCTAIYIYMPVFLKLDTISTYTYLEIRFDKNLGRLSSFIFIISMLLYSSIVLYVPSLGVSQATGISLHIIILFLCIICIFYTSVSGLRGVVWVDTLQCISMLASLLIILYMGIVKIEDFSMAWRKLSETKRLDIFNFRVDLTDRDTIWAHLFGSSTFLMYYFSINQASVQRFLSVRSIQHAKRSVLIYCFGMVIIKTICIIIGVLIFIRYSNCDPLSTKQVKRTDQLLPYFLEDVSENFPCLSGIFIAGVVSASLSTLSTTLNTLACVIYEDFVSTYTTNCWIKNQNNIVLKLIVVMCGLLCIALVYLIEQMGDVLPIFITFTGATGGPLLGLFTLGMLFPSANATGALCGGLGGLLLSFWMIIGNEWYKKQGFIQYSSKSLSVEGCSILINITNTIKENPVFEEQPFILYRVAFWYIPLFGLLAVIFIGLIVSRITKNEDHFVNPDLISSLFHFSIPKQEDLKLELSN